MYYSLINSMKKGGSAYTARTTAFATATGITDVTILGALNTFDLGLISNSLDTKMKAVYPFLGGTSSTHKFNFMDARDLDVAFRLSFSGGWTHSGNGITGNLVNTFANTFLIPSTQLTLTSGHYSIYSRTNVNETSIDLGVLNDNCHQIITRLALQSTYSYANTNTGISLTNTDSTGHYITNRNSTTNTTGFKNGVKVADAAMTAGLPINAVFIGARNQGGAGVIPSSRQYSFSSIGNGLTDGEATTFYNLVQAMQTTLSRQV